MSPRAALAALAAPHRYRVTVDTDGWLLIPGKLGRLEWHDGAELAVYTDRPRLIARLWMVPGIRRWQVRDQEVRGLFPPEALTTVALLIRARRRRRPAGSAAHLQTPPTPPYSATFSGVGGRLALGTGDAVTRLLSPSAKRGAHLGVGETTEEKL